MTEMSKEELLMWLKRFWSAYEASWKDIEPAYQQIRQIIEQSEQGEPCLSPVLEEEIEEKSEKRIPDPLALKQAIEAYEAMKRGESGVMGYINIHAHRKKHK